MCSDAGDVKDRASGSAPARRDSIACDHLAIRRYRPRVPIEAICRLADPPRVAGSCVRQCHSASGLTTLRRTASVARTRRRDRAGGTGPERASGPQPGSGRELKPALAVDLAARPHPRLKRRLAAAEANWTGASTSCARRSWPCPAAVGCNSESADPNRLSRPLVGRAGRGHHSSASSRRGQMDNGGHASARPRARQVEERKVRPLRRERDAPKGRLDRCRIGRRDRRARLSPRAPSTESIHWRRGSRLGECSSFREVLDDALELAFHRPLLLAAKSSTSSARCIRSSGPFQG